MPSVKARAKVIAEFCTEFGRYCLVLNKVGVLAVGVIGRERGWSDVFGYPPGVPRSAIEGGGCGEGGMEIGDRAWEAVLEEAVGIDGRNDIFEARQVGWSWRCSGRVWGGLLL